MAGVTPDLLLAATRKLIGIQRGTAQPDSRDSLANQTFHSAEDFFEERIDKDAGGIGRNILWKSTFKGKLASVPSGALTPQLQAVLLTSGLASPIEEINPIELYDQNQRVLRLGEGGIGSVDSIPDSAREVHPSQFGFIDPLRGPESEKLGVDTRITLNTYKGPDNKLYTDMRNVETGKLERISPDRAAASVIAFPGELASDRPNIRAMVNGRLAYVPRKLVKYELPDTSEMFNFSTNLVPFMSATQGNRLFMAGKMVNQALPLQRPEAPLVQSGDFYEQAGRHVGAIHAAKPGVVVSSRGGTIKISHYDGTTSTHELYENFPLNRKTTLTNTPVVKAGDTVKAGQLLARSNFTDDRGVAAFGTNLRVAFMPYKGLTFEDAYVISESAARKLASEHLYTPSSEAVGGVEHGRNKYVSLFPGKYNKQQLSRFDEDGAIKPGTRVKSGDPLILAVGRPSPKGEGQWQHELRKGKAAWLDKSVTWDHDADGVVTDVVKGKNGIQVAVKSYMPMTTGDKLSARYGDKGVVAKIIPDSKMPTDSQGRPFDIIQNPLTLPTRLNPAQLFEMQMAKVARKLGRPVKVPAFIEGSMVDYVQRELRKHGLSDTDAVYDPETGNTTKGIMTGEKFFMKLHHTAESKGGERSLGGYTSEDIPAKGGPTGAKTLANAGMSALLAHNAEAVMRDAKLVRGQRNEDYWRVFRQGFSPASPNVPMVYKKFVASMTAAGINMAKKGSYTHLLALTDKDIDRLSHGELTRPETVQAKDLSPIRGGLFDRGLTGGLGGGNYTHITLAEPMPNPVMEEPIRRMLGLTGKDLMAVIAGEKSIGGQTGGRAIRNALARIDVDKQIQMDMEQLRGARGAKRDNLVKRLRYLSTCKDHGLHPKDWVMDKVLVLPPKFRPISQIKDKTQIVADANYLYQDLMHNNNALAGIITELGPQHAQEERKALYKAFKAVTGLGDPVHPKLQEKGVAGLLRHVFGKHSPKHGMYQRRVLGAATDFAARGTITPNPALDIDQVGLPEEQAWELYKPFVVRRLVRRGMGSTDAVKQVEQQSDTARLEMINEMKERPLLITRAPVLHKYGIMAAMPVLTKGRTLQVSPATVSGFGADFDGNCTDFNSEILLDISKSGVYTECIDGPTVKEKIMRTALHSEVLVDGGMRAVVRIGDFPHLGESRLDKNGALVYEVPDGISVLSFDPTTCEWCYRPVRRFTVEQDVQLVKVKTRRKEVRVSDNESLAVFDTSTGGVMKVAPADAIGMYVPIVRRFEHYGTEGDFDLGWLYGALVSDGWISRTAVGYAKLDDGLRDRVVKLCRTRIHENFAASTYRSEPGENKYSRSAKVHMNGKDLAAALLPLTENYHEAVKDGRGALRKRIPSKLLLNGTEECLWGLFSGLLDGDACISVTDKKNGKSKNYAVLMYTSSEGLKNDIVWLCMRLGIRTGVTASRRKHTKHTAYTITLSAVDLYAHRDSVRLFGEKPKEGWARLLAAAPRQDDTDVIPLTKDEIDVLKRIFITYKSKGPYSAVVKGRMRRASMLEHLDVIREAGLTDLERRILQLDVTWEPVLSVEQDGRETVFDLEVEGTKVFVVNGGMLIYDTMSYHVPVSDDAVKEAKEKMLPSRNLLSSATFNPHYIPSQEYLLGLYQASTSKSRKQPTYFKDQAAVLEAFKRGEIGIGDPIIVSEVNS